MTLQLAPSHPQFIFLFAAIRRIEICSPIFMLRAIAENEPSARRLLSRDYVLCFAGRLPVQGAA